MSEWRDSAECDALEGVLGQAIAGPLPLPALCPICAKNSVHIYFHARAGLGGLWVWCSSCRCYSHGSGRPPGWWANDSEVDPETLQAAPEPLEPMAAHLDEHWNELQRGMRPDQASINVSDYVARPRDGWRERELQRHLRTMTQDEAFAFISEFIERDLTVGLELARRCLREPARFEQILRRGLERADASSIQQWLRCCLPPLGERRLVAILMHAAEDNPAGVRKALYWLEALIRNPEAMSNIATLKQRLQQSPRGGT